MKHGKIVILSVALLLLVAGVAAWFVFVRDADIQRDVVFEPSADDVPADVIGPLPLIRREGRVVLAPDVRFNLNTGSMVSMISQQTLAALRSLGCRVDSSFCLLYGRAPSGEMKLFRKVYDVDLPVYGYRTVITGRKRGRRHMRSAYPVGYIRNVRFVDGGDQLSSNTLGIDFLSRYVFDYEYDKSLVRLRRSLPEGYDYVGEIHRGRTPGDRLGASSLYYVDLKVDHFPYTFLIDTSLGEINLKIPAGNRTFDEADGRYIRCVPRIGSDDYEAVMDMGAWVTFGNRGGSSLAFYVNDGSEEPQANPLMFFSSDMAIDFPSKAYYMKNR
ncbi:MAG: hypothetical protein NC336_03300 [Clostridium sp.]|nr:hypothetical protein [Clostridium sp.]